MVEVVPGCTWSGCSVVVNASSFVSLVTVVLSTSDVLETIANVEVSVTVETVGVMCCLHVWQHI